MKVTIYNEPYGAGLGGSELMAAVTAEALSSAHEVELLHHNENLERDPLATFSETNLEKVVLRYVPSPDRGWIAPGTTLWNARRSILEWKADLSQECDLFFTYTHDFPPVCYAKHGVFCVHFPLEDRMRCWPRGDGPTSLVPGLKRFVNRVVYERLWERRIESYKVRLGNSRYVADWTALRWGVKCDVLAPPVRTDYPILPKENLIAVVGRFSTSKQQLELINAFCRIARTVPDWRMICVGTTSRRGAEAEYLRNVRDAALGGPVEILADVPRSVLRRILARSKVFWHAMGMGVDEYVEPERIEHFGIATVEAMAAGCVPMVIDRGGQREIVRMGIDGFRWQTIEELTDQFLRLVGDESELDRLGQSARQRAQLYSRDQFSEQLRRCLSPILTI